MKTWTDRLIDMVFRGVVGLVVIYILERICIYNNFNQRHLVDCTIICFAYTKFEFCTCESSFVHAPNYFVGAT